MTGKQLIFLFFFIFCTAAVIITSTGCANIIPPAGGPRDSLPPVLVKVTPPDSSRQFTEKRILFTFNEYVELQNAFENLVVSPLSKNFPSIDYRLNTVTVKLRDTLEPNTTYHLDFGNAVKDFNEGNVLKGFSYTFSTGNYIDSLELKGNVILAENGRIDTTLIVMLHTNPVDSAVVKDRPRYISKLDSKGSFVFHNLPPRTFYLYALKDEGGTMRYFNDRQLFAFADHPIALNGKTEPVTLYAYSSNKNIFQAVRPVSGGKGKQSAADKRLKYQTSLIANQIGGPLTQDLLSPFTMTFDQPLRSFDSTKIRLYTDSTFKVAGAYSFRLDTNRTIITLTHSWIENSTYHIIMDKEFAEDSSGRKLLKSDTLTFRTKKQGDYGSLKLRLKNIDMSKNPVLLIMQGENIYESFILTETSISQDMFLPGEYELRILYDSNKNGHWDPGDFFGKHKQPEIVVPLERKITVKAAFQNEFDVSL
jgi:hypothetical protein